MSTTLETALQDLDQSTDALLNVEQSDIPAVCSALERRADAITKIAFLVEEAASHEAGTLERLAEALCRGDEATRKVLRMKRDATDEWSQLNRLLHGLSETRPPKVDCSA
jgi:hypothetical protein